MVELQKSPDSPDIFKLDRCCYLTVKIDTFNRRPGPTQCYNCNLFNHSSQNCFIKTRCLKCGEPHKTGDCPIKEKIENPVCIDCKETGHLANSHRCVKFPKIKPKKGESSQNRNKPTIQNTFEPSTAKVQNNLTFASALKGKQMAPPLDKSESANSKSEATPAPPKEKRQPIQTPTDDEPFGFMDAIQELKKFFAEYPTLLELDKHHPDIIVIQETHLGPGDTLQIPNFTTYRNDRPYTSNRNPRGGTAIILKSSLSHHHTPTPPLDTAEATSVTLTPPNGDPILITSIYISPTKSYQHIHTDLETIFGLGHVSIVCGDYNAHHTHWGGQRIDQRGYIIKNFIDTTNTHILAPPTPTRFGFNSASIIDFALTRNLLWHSQVESIAELSSDHNPILISFDSNTRFDFPKRNISTDWELFRELLSPAHYSFKPITARTGEDVETQVADLTNTILNTHALSSKSVRNRNTYYINNDIKTLMIERNRARKTWQFTRNPNDKKVLNNIQNRLRRKIKAFQNKIWEDDLHSLDPDDGSLWNMSKELRNKKTPVYALNGRTGIANTDSEKAEVLACSLESQFQENNITNHTDHLINRIVENYFLNENNFDAPPLPPPMPSEVINYIKKTKVKRAPGREGITNKILQNLTLPVIFQLTNIISNIFTTGHFPSSWKSASVIPILKPGKPRGLADSYRPISLLPVLSKLAEKLILTRLNAHLTNNNILIHQQHGFRPRLSTSHQLLRVVEYVKTGYKDKKYTGAIFLDIQKAFDRVWYVGLIYKLIKINTPPQLILIIKSFLTNRNFAVRVNDTHSTTRNIKAGAPQGALLSPTLFNIYINDIPKTRHTTVCLFADDTAILAQSANKICVTHFLHRHLAELENWYNKWKISINPTKTEAVFFSVGRNIRKPPPIHIQNHPVPWSKSVKYLGVILDENLSFKHHILHIKQKFRALVCIYSPYFARNSPLTLKNRVLIYTSIIRPVILYASPVWGHAATSNINLLETSQNVVRRHLTNARWFMRNTCASPQNHPENYQETCNKILQ
ncbi:probable RNA-directed DNA polymerase from transposon X-element [Trichonephila clavipes]|nr:probable RNA-directed DNA polymerase from transposon X-element [Trichonephila clavipes]